MITEKDKKNLEDWLVMNLQMANKNNVDLIVRHIDHYFQSTEEVKEQDSKTIEDVLQKWATETFNKKGSLISDDFVERNKDMNGLNTASLSAMREWETITNKERDEKISKQQEEIDRLKGLIKQEWVAANRFTLQENKTNDAYIELVNNQWQQFKTDNQL